MKRDYIKHLIQCRCILLQFRQLEHPPIHKFVVFSEIEPDGGFCPSLAQCPNCGVVHKVKEVGQSDILRKEDLASVMTVDEIKSSVPEKIAEQISGYELEAHQWQEIKWIIENEAWGKSVLLVKDKAEGIIAGKAFQILSPSLGRITSFTKEDVQEVSK